MLWERKSATSHLQVGFTQSSCTSAAAAPVKSGSDVPADDSAEDFGSSEATREADCRVWVHLNDTALELRHFNLLISGLRLQKTQAKCKRKQKNTKQEVCGRDYKLTSPMQKVSK